MLTAHISKLPSTPPTSEDQQRRKAAAAYLWEGGALAQNGQDVVGRHIGRVYRHINELGPARGDGRRRRTLVTTEREHPEEASAG